MGRVALRGAVLAFVVVVGFVASPSARADDAPRQADRTALDRYVATPDPQYKYEVVDTVRGDGFTAYAVRMTSQKWLTEREVDHPVWQHWMWVIKPNQVTTSKALLFISGGSRGTPAP